MRLWRRTPKKSKPHRCTVPSDTDRDSVYRCICGNRFMLYGKWVRAEYKLTYLDGPNRWSIWLHRYGSTELTRMPSEATTDEAKAWARDLFLAEDLEILHFWSRFDDDRPAATYFFSYEQTAKGLRAIARSEMS